MVKLISNTALEGDSKTVFSDASLFVTGLAPDGLGGVTLDETGGILWDAHQTKFGRTIC